MRNSVVPRDLDELSVLTGQEEHSSLLTSLQDIPVHQSEMAFTPARSQSSYRPYPWDFLNSILDIIDDKTNGRAGKLQSVVTYLFFGGTAALVNLLVFYIMFYHAPLPGSPATRNVISYITAAELSIMANFIPNDRFTFSHLPGANRPWVQRCVRFHMTCIVGTLLTFLIEFSLYQILHTPAIIAEAIAIIIVLFYNFTAHHLFTYRHVKPAHS